LLGLILRADVPPYFDLLIDGFKAGRTGRHVHLGYWDAPPPLSSPCTADEFEMAQARLADVAIGLADLRDGQSVLDVGCGFGGTLAAINERWTGLRLTGVNIDPRQLDICRTVQARVGNSLGFELADACAMPFDSASFDRVICLEAMFHFPSRADFLHEAARVLRPGGRLALSDILLKRPGAAEAEVAALEQTMRREYGPWPELWIDMAAVDAMARRAGLRPERVIDATLQTLPSYRITAPREDGSAGGLMRWLHRSGHLSYACLSFTKA
jgi:SAM-dependent methyltransferase